MATTSFRQTLQDFAPGSAGSTRKLTGVLIAVVTAIVLLVIGTSTFETVDAHEILIVQSPGGKITTFASPGIHWQGFGKVTFYPKVITYEFKTPIRFNEGGHGEIAGQVQYETPVDEANLLNIYTKFGTTVALQKSLLNVVADKSIFMTGPLLSSTESYAEKRSNLIFWIEDQIVNGVYQTIRREVKVKDPISGEDKTVTVAEIATKDGTVLRQETSQLHAFGVHPFNFAVSNITYDERVEKQINLQQENAMAVQTAIAESKKAEQQTLTVEQQGRANAAKAKWEQEALKATAVTQAQQQLEVATLDAKAAGAEKQANILRGEGEAQRRRLVMQADNALDKKAEVWLKAQEVWANAIANYKGQWVPGVVMGGQGGTAGTNGATALMDMLTVKTARDLQLDIGVKAAGR